MKKRAKKQQGNRITVSMRNVYKPYWLAVQDMANSEDRKMRGVLDEAFSDILKKYGREVPSIS